MGWYTLDEMIDGLPYTEAQEAVKEKYRKANEDYRMGKRKD